MSTTKLHPFAGLRGRAGTVLAIAAVGASLLAAGPASADPVGQGSGSGRQGCKVKGVNPNGDKSGSTYTVPDGTKVTVTNPGGGHTEWTCSDGSWAMSRVAGGSHHFGPVVSSLHLQDQLARRLSGRKLTIAVRTAAPARASARLS